MTNKKESWVIRKSRKSLAIYDAEHLQWTAKHWLGITVKGKSLGESVYKGRLIDAIIDVHKSANLNALYVARSLMGITGKKKLKKMSTPDLLELVETLSYKGTTHYYWSTPIPKPGIPQYRILLEQGLHDIYHYGKHIPRLPAFNECTWTDWKNPEESWDELEEIFASEEEVEANKAKKITRPRTANMRFMFLEPVPAVPKQARQAEVIRTLPKDTWFDEQQVKKLLDEKVASGELRTKQDTLPIFHYYRKQFEALGLLQTQTGVNNDV